VARPGTQAAPTPSASSRGWGFLNRVAGVARAAELGLGTDDPETIDLAEVSLG
jgi:hypothetical protein